MILRQLDRPNLNLQAAYRKIPLIDEPVKQIRFMTIHARSVPNRTVQSLRNELSINPGGIGLADRLANLAPNELLACPTDHYERVRATILTVG